MSVKSTAKSRHYITVAVVFIWTLITLLIIGVINRNVLSHLAGVLWLAVAIIPWWLMLLATVIFMRRDKEGPKDLGFTKEKLWLQILLGFAVAAFTLAVFIVLPELVLGVRMGWHEPFTVWGFVSRVIFQLLAVAFVEEVVFRGHIFKKLLEIKDNKWFAILISSALFGLFHIFNFNIWQILVTAVMGVVWCIFREKLKHCTLLSLIIAHALHNALMPIVIGLFFVV